MKKKIIKFVILVFTLCIYKVNASELFGTEVESQLTGTFSSTTGASAVACGVTLGSNSANIYSEDKKIQQVIKLKFTLLDENGKVVESEKNGKSSVYFEIVTNAKKMNLSKKSYSAYITDGEKLEERSFNIDGQIYLNRDNFEYFGLASGKYQLLSALKDTLVNSDDKYNSDARKLIFQSFGYDSITDINQGYFLKIEPIYVYLVPKIIDGKISKWNHQINGNGCTSPVLGTAQQLFKYFLKTDIEEIGTGIPDNDFYNMIAGAYISDETVSKYLRGALGISGGESGYTLGQINKIIGLGINLSKYFEDNYINGKFNGRLIKKSTYDDLKAVVVNNKSVGAYYFSLKSMVYCNYNNPEDWEANKKGGPNAINANGINCCKIYSDKSDLCLDHPECCKPATYLFKGAKCSYIASENNASFNVNNSVDSWGNIFASIYSDGTGSGSSGNFLVSNLDDYAKLICKENISINYPGPINTIERFDNIGGHFIWPKNPSFSDDGLLKISSDVSCRVFLDVTGGDSYFNDAKILDIKNKAIDDMNKYNLSANLSVEYDDSSYGKLSSLVPETNEKNILNITSSGEDGATNYEKLKNTTYTFSASRYYVIDNDGYRFISKKDGKYYKTITGQKIYDKLNQAVLPVDVSNFSEEKNNATIIINKIGGFKQINIKSIEGGKNNNYTCKYNFVPTSNCECPMDSKHAQLDLSKYLINNKKTCPEAQKEYCNGSLPPGGDSYVCPEDENTICHGCSYATSWAQLISEYMKKNGGTYETAEEKTKEQAISNVCYGKKKMKIIYRTISLNNPFLGKNGDNRTPGTNWNDNKLRDSKGRLYSRWYLNESGKETSNISGNDLYNTNIEPLYTIELTPSIIKKIREYNKKNFYDDFNLSCLDESTKCISSFLDSEIKVTGKCSNVTNKSDFNNCIQ